MMRRKFFSVARKEAAAQRWTMAASCQRHTRGCSGARPTADSRSSWSWPRLFDQFDHGQGGSPFQKKVF
jgi:hypothetical protein